MISRRSFLGRTAFAAAGLGLAGAAGGADIEAKAKPAKQRLVVQMSDDDPKRWQLALNNIRNVQDALGKSNVDIELVAYGPGIGMLKMDSVAGSQIAAAVRGGVKVVACENTMRGQHLTKADMHPDIDYVAAGVVELMQKQQQGWAYIRP